MSNGSMEFKLISSDNRVTSIIINHTEIYLNGLKYIPDPTQPIKLSIYIKDLVDGDIPIKGNTIKLIMVELKKIRLSNINASEGIINLLDMNNKPIKIIEFNLNNLTEIEDILNSSEVNFLLDSNIH